MLKYICFAPSKEQFDVNGNSLGMGCERAIYYSKKIGKHRVYRQSYPIEPNMFKGKDINKDLELLYFNTKIEAQRLCTEINNVYGDDFIVREVKDGAILN